MALVGKKARTATRRGYGASMFPSFNGFRLSLTNLFTTNELEVEYQDIPGTWNNGNWHHLCWTYAGTSGPSGIALYLDGISRALVVLQNSLTGTIQNPFVNFGQGAFAVGTSAVGDYWRDGNLDEASVWNKALSPAEVAAMQTQLDLTKLFAYMPSCVSWWRNGDPLGPVCYPTIADRKGTNPGTMTGMVAGDIVADAPP